ncbi:MAG: NfeD family protein [Lachnospiraceae bacterium]|nr:NfeD family protein [Lachnospiraceae bacterium]
MSLSIIWLIVLVVCLAIEISTLGLTSIWFAGGALLALIISMIGGPLWLQVLVFLLTSIVLLIFTRPIAMKYFNKNRTKTNVDSKIGKQAIVTETIDNLKGVGRIVTDGMEWTARSLDSTVIEEGAVVTIEKIEGVKAIVKIRKEGE